MIKTVLYYGGLPIAHLRVLYPAPMYELPDDAIVEITGVLQVVPAFVTGRLALKMAAHRLRSSRTAHGASKAAHGASRP